MTNIKFKIKEANVRDLNSGDFFVFGDAVYLLLDSQFEHCRVYSFDTGEESIFAPEKIVNPLNTTILLSYQEDTGNDK